MVAVQGTIEAQQLRAFVEVANRGGVTAAAIALGIAKSAVSRQLTALEASLRTRLFERTSRKVILTPEGRRLLSRAESILADMDRLIADAAEEVDDVRGTVRITAPPEFGQLLAEQFLPILMARHPDLVLLMSLDYAFEDLHDPATDLAFRLGSVADDRLVARPLGNFSRVLVCSRTFAAEYPVTGPDDLRNVNALLFGDRHRTQTWHLERHGDRASQRGIEVGGNLGIRGFAALAVAAGAGLGVAFLPSFFAKARLATGELYRLLDDWASPPYPVYVAYRPTVGRIRRVRAVIDLASEIIPTFLMPNPNDASG